MFEEEEPIINCEMCGRAQEEGFKMKECSLCEMKYCPYHIPTKDHSCFGVIEENDD